MCRHSYVFQACVQRKPILRPFSKGLRGRGHSRTTAGHLEVSRIWLKQPQASVHLAILVSLHGAEATAGSIYLKLGIYLR